MMRALLRSSALVLVLTALKCPDKGSDFFGPSVDAPQTGGLTGTVLFGSTPLAGANVVLSTTPSISVTTPANGTFSFNDLNVGSYSLTTTLSGYTCPTQTAVIQLDKIITLNVPCTPVPGSVTGTVRVNGNPQGGVAVTVKQNGVSKGTGQTAANGTYTIASIPPGAYSVEITPPANTVCSNNPQNVTVLSAQAAAANFDCEILTGSISGTVVVDGQPKAGVQVTVTAGSDKFTQVTASNGTFLFLNLTPRAYVVGVDPPAGSSCAITSQSATVTANQNTAVNFSCASLPGSVSGTVSGVAGELVTVTVQQADGTRVSGVLTNIDGSYSIANIPAGTYTVVVTAPIGKICSAGVVITVQPGQNASANFSCSVLTFTVDLGVSYRHVIPNVSSEVCVDISAFDDATYTVEWTGPGLIGSGTRSGVADGDGDAFDRQAINVLGTYNVKVTATRNGVTVTNSKSIVVTSDPGTCPAP